MGPGCDDLRLCLALPTSNRFTDLSQVSNYVWDFAGSLLGLAAVASALLLPNPHRSVLRACARGTWDRFALTESYFIRLFY
jgi:hypothetical protein